MFCHTLVYAVCITEIDESEAVVGHDQRSSAVVAWVQRKQALGEWRWFGW